MAAIPKASINAAAAPMPIPTCEPVDNTVPCVALVVAAGADAIVGEVVLTDNSVVAKAAGVLAGSVLGPVEGLAMTEVGERDVVVSEGNNERSCCSNSMVIAWPHIVTGPVMVVLLSCESPERALTVVGPLSLA